MTIKEASEHLGVAPNTLRNWGKSGKIQERRHPVNGYRLYSRKELDQLLKSVESPSRKKPKPK